MIKRFLLIFILLCSGCATIIDSPMQDINITPIPTTESNANVTECRLINEEGDWKVKFSHLSTETVNIHRDGNPMSIQCENSTQIGSTTVIPEFRVSYLLWDFILGYCTVSCSVDAYTNALYEYPSNITVPMTKK